MTAVILAILLSLGTWQLQRREWKLALLAAINAAEAGPARLLTPNPAPFSKVVVAGEIPPEVPTAFYGAEVRADGNGPPRMGSQLITVLRPAQGHPVLVNHGWVATNSAPMPPRGPVRIEGYVRPADARGWFAANDDPVARRFYTMDPAAIGAAIGFPSVAPYVIVAVGPAPAAGLPDPARQLPRPPNDHLSYALTWFGLAAALAVIFIVYAHKVLRA